ncbi:protein phosphatase 2C domain-containing protein [Superficieibacter sp.]|uniref:PP2C family protein-serine/threonine phosphatase n=1 Tax=Superficieibacter sp. TaxID=2303322 RepID=UPI0028AEC41C|nr:protein phosphatase 2C domain-containing protein [Superficieibacter sp.]
MNITTASLSRQGTRASNQDQTGETIGERSACFLVCDGVAGLPGGHVAAELARDTILSRFDGASHLNAQYIRHYVQEANRAIISEQQAVQDYHRMGTTLVSLFIDRDYRLAYWAHAGDSRLYLFRRGWLYHVTTDHSLVQQMKDAGHQTDDINSNLLYLALGMANGGPEASYSDIVPLEDGDVFLLCTDGFWHGVSEEQMKQSLHMVNTPQEWLTLMNQLIQKNGDEAKGAQDNYSAVAVWMGSPHETTLLHTVSEAAQFFPLLD